MNRRLFVLLTLVSIISPLASLFTRGFSPNAVENEHVPVASMDAAEAEALFPPFSSLARPIDVSQAEGEDVRPPREVSDDEIARAAEHLASEADTPYLLWTDLCRLETYLLERKRDGWSLLRRLPCSVGDASNPTPEGFYHIGVHRLSFGRQGYYSAAYAMQISGNYLYHSVLLTPNGDGILDGRLGERISHGCIRHSLDDSRWLYETVPDGTAVLIR